MSKNKRMRDESYNDVVRWLCGWNSRGIDLQVDAGGAMSTEREQMEAQLDEEYVAAGSPRPAANWTRSHLLAARLKLAEVERERNHLLLLPQNERACITPDAPCATLEDASLKLAAADRLAEAYADHVCSCEQPYCGAQPVGVFRCERCGKCCAESLRSALLEYSRTKV